MSKIDQQYMLLLIEKAADRLKELRETVMAEPKATAMAGDCEDEHNAFLAAAEIAEDAATFAAAAQQTANAAQATAQQAYQAWQMCLNS